MEINLEKKHFALIAALCLILTTGLVAANQETILRFANPSTDILPGHTVGHSSADLVVNLDGGTAVECSGDISLQAAIDSGCLGSGGGLTFDDWVPRNFDQVYGPAATDGFVFVSTNWAYLNAYKGNSETTLVVVSREAPASQGPQPSWGSITMPVKKGEYWKVDGSSDSTPMVYWIPIIAGGNGFTPADMDTTGWGNDSDGEMDYPNGFQMKWGSATIPPNSTGTITFTTPFDNACFQVIYSRAGDTLTSWRHHVSSVSASNVVIDNTANNATLPIGWMAIGR